MKRKAELLRATSHIVSLANSGQILCARKMFDGMPYRDTVAWNAMLAAYARLGLHGDALSLFPRMTPSPDHFTLTSALTSCAATSRLSLGESIHASIVVSGFRSVVPVGNALVDMYGKCFRPWNACRVFEEMGFRNEVSWCSLLFAFLKSGEFEAADRSFAEMPTKVEIAWNVMISGYARFGEVERCLAVFKEMLESSCAPDQWAFSSLVNACSESLAFFIYGRMVHCFIFKSGWSFATESMNSVLSLYAEFGCHRDVVRALESFGEQRNHVSWNAIIDAYMKIGDVERAFLEFHRAPVQGLVLWTSLITGYTRNGRAEEAVSSFVGMMRSGTKPDDFAFGAVLHACSNLAALGHGKMVHGTLIHHGFEEYVYVGNGLVNMYAKCGHINSSNRAFSEIRRKDIVSWNAMLFAFGLHGNPHRAIGLFKEMVANGVKPDKVTFIGLLVSCSHAGLVSKCLELFKTMRSVHGVSTEADHITCVVDALGRSGHLVEAKELADKLGVDASVYEPLLGACSTHREVGQGAFLGNTVREVAPQEEMGYVLLSNIYCAGGRWLEAEGVRRTMAEGGVKKTPGCSWIEVRNQVVTFVAGNSSAELSQLLTALHFQTRIPNFDNICQILIYSST